MNRYLLKFEKKDALRYTSHLDLLRIFRRAFKRANIELEYSRGFNPHPKMGFAQPLSLGYTSLGEYLEFDTVMPYNEDFIIGLLNSSLPYGIKVLDCCLVEDAGKSAAALVCSASYEVKMPEGYALPGKDQIDLYLDQAEIIVSKPVKKGKEILQVNIKPMIHQLFCDINSQDDNVIRMVVDTGSTSNLNPELLLSSLFDFCELPFEKGLPQIMRLEIFKEDGKALSM